VTFAIAGGEDQNSLHDSLGKPSSPHRALRVLLSLRERNEVRAQRQQWKASLMDIWGRQSKLSDA
jgi:hypothetical protein